GRKVICSWPVTVRWSRAMVKSRTICGRFGSGAAYVLQSAGTGVGDVLAVGGWSLNVRDAVDGVEPWPDVVVVHAASARTTAATPAAVARTRRCRISRCAMGGRPPELWPGRSAHRPSR